MALDETLVNLRPNEVTLRFFNWTSGPAVTYGYAQFYKEVLRALPEGFAGGLTRRPTGGGVVFHTDDLTFSLVFEYPGRPSEIYKKLHDSISAELARVDAQKFSLSGSSPVEAYRPSHAHSANACFQNPVENDVLAADGAKVLGGALRRFGTTVLYQGSLQLKDARKNPAYKQAVINGVRRFLAVDFTPRGIAADTLQTARTLAQTCYATQAWKGKF